MLRFFVPHLVFLFVQLLSTRMIQFLWWTNGTTTIATQPSLSLPSAMERVSSSLIGLGLSTSLVGTLITASMASGYLLKWCLCTCTISPHLLHQLPFPLVQTPGLPLRLQQSAPLLLHHQVQEFKFQPHLVQSLWLLLPSLLFFYGLNHRLFLCYYLCWFSFWVRFRLLGSIVSAHWYDLFIIY